MSEPVVLAVDLGGTSIRTALVDRRGQILARSRVGTDAQGGPESVVRQIAAEVQAIRAGGPPPVGFGLSSPGPLDPEAGIVFAMPSFKGWTDVPLRRMVMEATGLELTLENDAASAALAEWRFGAGKGVANLAYATISTGLGGGVIVDGRLLHGRKGLAGHIGHMTIDPNGPRCGCGNLGCWEGHASGTAFGKLASARLGRSVRAEEVIALARAGDPVAIELVEQEARYLGIGIVSLFHLFSPDRVILGGGLSTALDLFMAGIEREIETRAMAPFKAIPVLPAGCGVDAGLIGAAVVGFMAAQIPLP